jgi:hypothetical protein
VDSPVVEVGLGDGADMLANGVGVLATILAGVEVGGKGVAVGWPPASWIFPCRLVTTLVSTVICPLASDAAWAVMNARSPLLDTIIGWPLLSVALARLDAQVPLAADRTEISSDCAPELVTCSLI